MFHVRQVNRFDSFSICMDGLRADGPRIDGVEDLSKSKEKERKRENETKLQTNEIYFAITK